MPMHPFQFNYIQFQDTSQDQRIESAPGVSIESQVKDKITTIDVDLKMLFPLRFGTWNENRVITVQKQSFRGPHRAIDKTIERLGCRPREQL